MIVSLISLILVGIWGFFVYSDLKIWSENLQDTDIGFIITDNKSMVTTFEIVFKNQSIINTTSKKSTAIKNAYISENYSNLQDSKIFKIISFDMAIINDDIKVVELNETLNGKNVMLKLTKAQLLTILRSNRPKNELKAVYSDFDLTNVDIDDTNVKAFLFFQTINSLDSESQIDLVSTFKIYPKDSITKTAEFIPWNFVKNTMIPKNTDVSK